MRSHVSRLGHWLPMLGALAALACTAGSDKGDAGSSGIETNLLIARSSDGGVTWTDPVPLSASDAALLGDDRGPALASDLQGEWIAAWDTSKLGDLPRPETDIALSRSSDVGANWTPRADLNNNADTDEGADNAVDLATDGAGTWIALWESWDSLGDTIGTDGDLLFARSTDDGASWSDPAPLNSLAATDTEDDKKPRLATDGAGNWVATWYTSEGYNLPPKPEFGNVTFAGGYSLWEIDIDEEESTEIAPHPDTGQYFRNLAGTSEGMLYTVDGDDLYEVNPKTAAMTRVGTLRPETDGDPSLVDSSIDVYGYGDVLYGFGVDPYDSWDQPYIVELRSYEPVAGVLTTHVTTPIASSTLGVIEHIAVMDSDTAYIVSGGNPTSSTGVQLHRIDLNTGAATWIGWIPHTAGLRAIDNDDSGRLFGVFGGDDTTPAQIFEISTTDASLTFVADAARALLYSLAFPLPGLPADRDILMAYSSDDGVTWSASAPLNGNAVGDSGGDSDPQIATDGTTWIAVWKILDIASPSTVGATESLETGNDDDLLYARSFDAGATWTYPEPLNNNALDTKIDRPNGRPPPLYLPRDDRNPQLATDGSVWIAVWASSDTLASLFSPVRDKVGSDFDIHLARSTDAGASWSDPTWLNNNAQTDALADTSPHLATDGTTWIATWLIQTLAGPDLDIRMARSTDGGLTWSDPEWLNSNATTDDGDDTNQVLTTDGQGNWIAIWQSRSSL